MAEEKECCPDCESNHVTESIKRQSFPYGSGENQVTLEATMPVFICQDCGATWFDERGEAVRSVAVFAHLEQIKARKKE